MTTRMLSEQSPNKELYSRSREYRTHLDKIALKLASLYESEGRNRE